MSRETIRRVLTAVLLLLFAIVALRDDTGVNLAAIGALLVVAMRFYFPRPAAPRGRRGTTH